MPELDTRFGYYTVVVVMAVICFFLWRRFKKIGWL